MSYDHDHLKVLSIFHFILGGMAALAAPIPAIHLTLGLGMVGGLFSEAARPPAADSPEVVVGWFFVFVASVCIVAFLTFAALTIRAGVCLANTRNYGFCMVIACVESLIFPFGTLLGGLTVVVLLRPSVKQLFGVAPPAGPPEIFKADTPETEPLP